MNLYLNFLLNNNWKRMKRSISFGMVMLHHFEALQNLRNCPKDYPFAVSGGKRCMNIFEVHSNITEYQYRIGSEWLQRCCRRMLETKFDDDNNNMLVTVLAILVTIIDYLFTLASGTNIQKMSSTSLSSLKIRRMIFWASIKWTHHTKIWCSSF